jgi:hypothetical protein
MLDPPHRAYNPEPYVGGTADMDDHHVFWGGPVRAIVLALAGAGLIATLVLVSTGSASASAARTRRIGSAPQLVSGSRVVGSLAGAEKLKVDVTLAPRNPAALAAYATAVATPGSSVYHHYLTVAQFAARFGPTKAHIAAVESELRTAGLHPGSITRNDLSIPITATAGKLGHAFSTRFDSVRLKGGRRAFANTSAPQFSTRVAGYVQGVIGLNTLALPHPVDLSHARSHLARAPHVVTGGQQPCNAASGVGNYTADQIASAYRFSNLYETGDEGAGQTIALYELEPNVAADIPAYQRCYDISPSLSYVEVDGGPGAFKSGDGEETELDIEDAMGLAPEANFLVYQGPNSGTGGYDTYSAIITGKKANVISSSWGACESSEGSSNASSENTLFQEASTEGISMFASSGDDGSEDCGSRKLAVDDPASQPYVTGVGGTSMSALGPAPTESVWNDECSDGPCGGGGGISTFWTMPSYQSGAPAGLNVINSNSSRTPCGASSGDCREVPDVSADADPATGYVIYYDGSWEDIGGTSASTPTWAAFTALVNASSGCNGTAIGFANPALYKAAGAAYSSDFNDVTSGENDIKGTNGGKFAAGTAYDMASGLGTPNGATLPAALCGANDTLPVATVTNPGNQSTLEGSSVSVHVYGADSDGGTLTYSATGLPAGLSIAPSSGLITGTPTAPGTSSVTATATDATGPSASATFSWTIAPSGTVTGIGTVALPDAGSMPTGVVVDTTNHIAYIAESHANAVAKITGTNAGSFSGTAADIADASLCAGSCALPGLGFPDDLALNTSGQVFASDYCVGTQAGVCAGEASGTTTAISQQTGASSGQKDTLTGCSYPAGVADFTATTAARLFVACAGSGVVAECSPSSGGTPACGTAAPATVAVTEPTGSSSSPVPSGLAAIPTTTTTPSVVVADADNSTVSVVSLSGSTLSASTPVSLGSGCSPAGVAIGPSVGGTAAVYVACPGTGTIEVGTVSGTGTPALGSFSAINLPTTGTSVPSPYGVAVNAAGTLLAVTDSANSDLVAYPSLSGTTLGPGYVVGVGATPDGVGIDGANAFVANEGSNNVSVVDPSTASARGHVVHASRRAEVARRVSWSPLVAPLPAG